MERVFPVHASSPAIFPADFDWSAWVGLPPARWPVHPCWSFVCAVVEAGLGVRLPTFAPTTPDAMRAEGWRAQEEALQAWHPVSLDQVQPFDLIVFRGRPPHVGVACGLGRFLHLREHDLSAAGTLRHRWWRTRLDGLYRYCP